MTHRVEFAALACLVAITPAAAAPDAREQARRIEAILQDLRPVTAGVQSDSPSTLAEEMAARHVPAVSIALIDGGRIAWARAFGVADVASGRKATTKTLFQAASISKSIAATAALNLVQQGKLALDEDVNARLTSWQLTYGAKANGKVVTLRQLLSHTGGLNVAWFIGYDMTARTPTVLQILNGESPANSPKVAVDQEPGSAYRYSGGGTMVAQMLMTDATKQSLPELARRLVLAPAGMSSSTYEQPLPRSERGKAATGYMINGVEIAHRYHVYPEQAAAGLWTTPSDLARWVLTIQRAYAGRSSRVINQATAKAMLTAGPGDWGLGVEIEGKGDGLRFTHGGSNLGYKALVVGYETGGRGYVIMTNGEGGGPIALELSAAIARAYGWPTPPRKDPARK